MESTFAKNQTQDEGENNHSSLSSFFSFVSTAKNTILEKAKRNVRRNRAGVRWLSYLPEEIWLQVLFELDPLSVITVSEVNCFFYRLVTDHHLWQHLCRRHLTSAFCSSCLVISPTSSSESSLSLSPMKSPYSPFPTFAMTWKELFIQTELFDGVWQKGFWLSWLVCMWSPWYSNSPRGPTGAGVDKRYYLVEVKTKKRTKKWYLSQLRINSIEWVLEAFKPEAQGNGKFVQIDRQELPCARGSEFDEILAFCPNETAQAHHDAGLGWLVYFKQSNLCVLSMRTRQHVVLGTSDTVRAFCWASECRDGRLVVCHIPTYSQLSLQILTLSPDTVTIEDVLVLPFIPFLYRILWDGEWVVGLGSGESFVLGLGGEGTQKEKEREKKEEKKNKEREAEKTRAFRRFSAPLGPVTMAQGVLFSYTDWGIDMLDVDRFMRGDIGESDERDSTDGDGWRSIATYSTNRVHDIFVDEHRQEIFASLDGCVECLSYARMTHRGRMKSTRCDPIDRRSYGAKDVIVQLAASLDTVVGVGRTGTIHVWKRDSTELLRLIQQHSQHPQHPQQHKTLLVRKACHIYLYFGLVIMEVQEGVTQVVEFNRKGHNSNNKRKTRPKINSPADIRRTVRGASG